MISTLASPCVSWTPGPVARSFRETFCSYSNRREASDDWSRRRTCVAAGRAFSSSARRRGTLGADVGRPVECEMPAVGMWRREVYRCLYLDRVGERGQGEAEPVGGAVDGPPRARDRESCRARGRVASRSGSRSRSRRGSRSWCSRGRVASPSGFGSREVRASCRVWGGDEIRCEASATNGRVPSGKRAGARCIGGAGAPSGRSFVVRRVLASSPTKPRMRRPRKEGVRPGIVPDRDGTVMASAVGFAERGTRRARPGTSRVANR